MNWSVFILIGVVFGGMMMIVQRAQANRRLLVAIILAPPFAACWLFASTQNAIDSAWLALAAAILLNALFWLLVGRYNPVARSEDIRVLKMDD